MTSFQSPERHSKAATRAATALPAHLHRRGSTYYFKRKIPSDVRSAFPSAKGDQLWKSLDTNLLAHARVMLAVEVGRFDAVVARARHENAVAQAEALVSQVRQSSSAEMRAPPAPAEQAVAVESLPQGPLVRASSIRSSAQRVVSVSTVAETRYTIEHLFGFWKKTQTKHRTIEAVHKVVIDFQRLHGLLRCHEVTRQHARDYRDVLIDAGLAEGTISNRIGFLSTLWRFGQVEIIEDIRGNPFERIPVVGAQPVRAEKDRRAFTVSELNLLFRSEVYTDKTLPRGQASEAAYWVPLLGPLVGGRIEELAQLRIDDVERINGDWCLRICDLGEDQTIKTKSSFRRVPLHALLMKCGFLAFVARQAKAGHERVFHTLSNENANGTWSNALGKWYGRHLDKIGLSDRRLDFHSNRYTFRQQCSLCGIQNEVRDALTGHWSSNRDAGRTYMRAHERQYPLPLLVAAMSALRYDELRLDHLYVDEPMRGVQLLLK